MTWRPVSGNHSIERVRVSFAFSAQIPSKASARLAGMIEGVRADFGLGPMTSIDSQSIMFGFGVAPQPIPQPVLAKGWKFERKAAAGNTVEVIACEANILSYETSEYGRWETFKNRFDHLVLPVCRDASEYFDISLLSLEYYDRFIFAGRRNQADPSLLLSDLSIVIGDHAARTGEMWHLHRGWFEDFSDRKILINQNFDAQDAILDDRETMTIQVLTKADLRSSFGEILVGEVSDYLDSMHRRTNELFAENLTAEIRNSIGLLGAQ